MHHFPLSGAGSSGFGESDTKREGQLCLGMKSKSAKRRRFNRLCVLDISVTFCAEMLSSYPGWSMISSCKSQDKINARCALFSSGAARTFAIASSKAVPCRGRGNMRKLMINKLASVGLYWIFSVFSLFFFNQSVVMLMAYEIL